MVEHAYVCFVVMGITLVAVMMASLSIFIAFAGAIEEGNVEKEMDGSFGKRQRGWRVGTASVRRGDRETLSDGRRI